RPPPHHLQRVGAANDFRAIVPPKGRVSRTTCETVMDRQSRPAYERRASKTAPAPAPTCRYIRLRSTDGVTFGVRVRCSVRGRGTAEGPGLSDLAACIGQRHLRRRSAGPGSGSAPGSFIRSLDRQPDEGAEDVGRNGLTTRCAAGCWYPVRSRS